MATERVKSKPSFFNKVFLYVFFFLLAGVFLFFTSFAYFFPAVYSHFEKDMLKKDIGQLQTDVAGTTYKFDNFDELPEALIFQLQDFASDNNTILYLVYKTKHYEFADSGIVSISDVSSFSQSTYDRFNLASMTDYYSFSWDIQVNDDTLSLTSISRLLPAGGTARFIFYYLPIAMIIIIIVAALIASLYSRLITKPIKELNTNAKRMAAFDFNLVSTQNYPAYELDDLNETMYALSKNLKCTLDQLHTELEEKEKRELFRKDFLASISHDLKTPLTALIGQIEILLKNNAVTDVRYANYLHESYAILHDMQAMIQDILTIAYLESTSLELEITEIDFFDLIGHLFTLFRQAIVKRHFEFKVDSNVDDAILYADAHYFKNAVQNIISNAIKYTPDGGKIEVNYTNTEHAIIISVKNSISQTLTETELERVFESFYRIDKSRTKSGNGLGLPITKNILNAHNFDFSFESSDNSVLFKIIIPKK